MSQNLKQLPTILAWPLSVIVLHVLLIVTGGYYWWEHVDKVMHVLGGVSIALSGLSAVALLEQRGMLFIKSYFITVIIILALVALAAVNWEFFEYILDRTTNTHMQPSIADTMGDLLAGLVGGLLVTFVGYFKR
jgi:hypothetical protein